MLHIIIDGYNVIRRSVAFGQFKPDKDLGRTQFLREVSKYYQNKKCLVLVVFDGTQSDNRSVEELHQDNMQVYFSKFGQTADDLIIEMAKQRGPEALVVSSDQGIIKAIKAYGCAAISSDEFLQRWHFETRVNQGFDKEETEPQRRIHTEKKGPKKKRPRAERRALSKLSKI